MNSTPEHGVRNVRIEDIVVRPQVRHDFNDDKLTELAASIREKGVLQPVLLRPVGRYYELVAGERRFRASRLAGLLEMPANVQIISDDEVEDVQVIENLHREDLNEIEKIEALLRVYARQVTQTSAAEAAKTLRWLRKHKDDPDQAQLLAATDRFFRERNQYWESFASSHLVNLGYPDDLKDMVRKKGMEISKIKVLKRIKDETLRREIARRALDENWSVRRLREEVDTHDDRRRLPPRAERTRFDYDVVQQHITALPRGRQRRASKLLEELRAVLEN